MNINKHGISLSRAADMSITNVLKIAYGETATARGARLMASPTVCVPMRGNRFAHKRRLPDMAKMAKGGKPIIDENPEWTKQDFAKSTKRAFRFLSFGDEIKRSRGRHQLSARRPDHLRLDQDVIEAMRASGKGGAPKANEALAKSFNEKARLTRSGCRDAIHFGERLGFAVVAPWMRSFRLHPDEEQSARTFGDGEIALLVPLGAAGAVPASATTLAASDRLAFAVNLPAVQLHVLDFIGMNVCGLVIIGSKHANGHLEALRE